MEEELMAKLKAQLSLSSEKNKKSDTSAQEVINKASESFFPLVLRSPVLVMTCRKMSEEDIPTIVLGTVTDGFTPEMFQRDMETAREHFKKPSHFYDVQMIPVKGNIRSLDSKDATDKIENTISRLNEETVSKTIRIIRIGIASTVFQNEAIIFLIKQWKCPPEEKCVHFVIAGDSEDNEMTNLCKLMVLSQDVKEIIFYNTQDYHPFGKIKSSDSIVSCSRGVGSKLKKLKKMVDSDDSDD